MAKLRNGIFSKTSGKVGSVIAQQWRDSNVVRSTWKSTAEPSAKQTAARAAYKEALETAQKWYSINSSAQNVNFSGYLSSTHNIFQNFLKEYYVTGGFKCMITEPRLYGREFLTNLGPDFSVSGVTYSKSALKLTFTYPVMIRSSIGFSYPMFGALVYAPLTGLFYWFNSGLCSFDKSYSNISLYGKSGLDLSSEVAGMVVYAADFDEEQYEIMEFIPLYAATFDLSEFYCTASQGEKLYWIENS